MSVCLRRDADNHALIFLSSQFGGAVVPVPGLVGPQDFWRAKV